MGLVEVRAGVVGDLPRFGPDRFRQDRVRVDAPSDLDAACDAVGRIDPDLHTLTDRVPLARRVKYLDGPAVLAVLNKVVLAHACDGAGCTLAELHAVRGDSHLQVARFGPVDAAPVAADHQGEGFAPGIRRGELTQAHVEGCCDLPDVDADRAVLGVDQAGLAKDGFDGFECPVCSWALSGRVGDGHLPPPVTLSRLMVCTQLGIKQKNISVPELLKYHIILSNNCNKTRHIRISGVIKNYLANHTADEVVSSC